MLNPNSKFSINFEVEMPYFRGSIVDASVGLMYRFAAIICNYIN